MTLNPLISMRIISFTWYGDHKGVQYSSKLLTWERYNCNFIATGALNPANDDTVEEHPSDMSFTYSINRSGPKI